MTRDHVELARAAIAHAEKVARREQGRVLGDEQIAPGVSRVPVDTDNEKARDNNPSDGESTLPGSATHTNPAG